VRDVLLAADRDDIVDAAQLVVSELVTNAILHTATPIELFARVDADGLLVEVSDGSTTPPTERAHAALAGTGRGLTLIHDLSAGWGVRDLPNGKVVWACITTSQEAAAHREVVLAPTLRDLDLASVNETQSLDVPGSPVPRGVGLAPSSADLAVVLRNLPLLMHVAWHEHAETMLREYLLSRLELDEAVALTEHALASAVMALLHEQVPSPELPGGASTLDEVTELLTSVVEPAATLRVGRLRIPAETVAGFEVLDQLMDAAIVLAEADELLAAPMQPELRELRRWLCGQVASQSVGAEPVPWSPPPAILPAPGTGVLPADWDRAPVDRSTKALVAADDTNRIIAVSAPALALLGYDEPGELVGQRLLALIPSRFHQGHLAGFTLHLTQGRAPLIGTAAIVPFVRADGTETDLELLVEALSTTNGRRVFVATLRPPT
jgi:PAS domain S-box-containing protein